MTKSVILAGTKNFIFMKKYLWINSFLVFILLSSFAIESQRSQTILRITVRDDLGNLVQNAMVTLYASEDDYRNMENPVAESGYTNQKGIVIFRDLQPVPYFVDVQKDDLSNEGAGVRVKRLDRGKSNRVTIIIQ
jgi:hypothetical protein